MLLSETSIDELRERRRAAGIPATLLASKTGIDRGRISSWENGHSVPAPEDLQRLASALDELVASKRAARDAALAAGWAGSRVA